MILKVGFEVGDLKVDIEISKEELVRLDDCARFQRYALAIQKALDTTWECECAEKKANGTD